MGKPAARLVDMMSNAGMITGPGAPTVLINKMPAARVGDMHTTPMVTPGTPPIPQVGGPIVGPGCANVLISKMPAAVVGDMATTVGPPGTIMLGSMNVLIGMNGSGGGGGGGSASAALAQAAQGLKAGTVSPVEGTEAYPIEIQTQALVMQEYLTPQGQKLDLAVIDAMAQSHAQQEKNEEKLAKITIQDFAEMLKTEESENGVEKARFFASRLTHDVLNDKAKAFINGTDTNPKNDPNIMPSRFMLLWGADDAKLQETNEHPDSTEHKITVANLRKGLRAIGYDVEETGTYDDKLDNAVAQYSIKVVSGCSNEQTYTVEKGEDLGMIAQRFRLPSWKYLYEYNKDEIGENPDLLEPGTELEIPQWDSTTCDERIQKRGGNPSLYVGGRPFIYPWELVSGTLADFDGSVYTETNQSSSFEKKKPYEIKDGDTGAVLASGEIGSSEELNVLVPDVAQNLLVVDGEEYRIWNGEEE